MSLTMDFSATLDAFYSPLDIQVEDVKGAYVDGEWIWQTPVTRMNAAGTAPLKLQAIVLQLSLQSLFFYKEGNVSDGGIALLTQTPLYFTNIDNTGELNVQSYVLYQNMRFRVIGDGFISGPLASLTGNANFKCYHCLRDIQ